MNMLNEKQKKIVDFIVSELIETGYSDEFFIQKVKNDIEYALIHDYDLKINRKNLEDYIKEFEKKENSNLNKALEKCNEIELRMQNERTFTDAVNHPQHYSSGGIECIDAIESSMTKEEFKGYLKGNMMKYIWRYDKKNGKEDLEKAKWYLDKLIKQL